MKALYTLLVVLFALSVLPLFLLRSYILLTGDFNARWYFIRYVSFQAFIWVLFGLTLFAVLLNLC